MKKPFITVAMPVYNGARFLGSAIESILTQSYVHFELIICDDGSQDQSFEIATAMAHNDSRITCLSKEHSGIAEATNAAIRRGKGEYIALMDQDDLAFPDRLEKQIERLLSDPEVSVLGGEALLIDVDGQTIGELRRRTRAQGLNFQSMLSFNEIINSTAMMTRTVFEAVGGYRKLQHIGAEDYDLWLRIIPRHPLDNLKDFLVKHRSHTGQASFALLPSQILSAHEAKCFAARNGSGAGYFETDPQTGDEGMSRSDDPSWFCNSVVVGYLEYALRYRSTGRGLDAEQAMEAVREFSKANDCSEMLRCHLLTDQFRILFDATI